MTTAIKRTAPPQALIKAFNPLMRLLLRSRLHGLLDSSVLLLHVVGRKSGRHYDIPVNYVDIDGLRTIVTIATWRVNLRGGADVEMTWSGRRRRMRAWLDEDPASVAVAYSSVIQRLGWRKASRHLGISMPGGMAPTLSELKEAAREYGWTVVTLTAR